MQFLLTLGEEEHRQFAQCTQANPCAPITDDCQWFSNARTIQRHLQSASPTQADSGRAKYEMIHVPVNVRSVENTVTMLHDAVLERISSYFDERQ